MIKTYFTFMMISYLVQGEEVKTSILLPSFDDCSYAIQHMSDILKPYGKDAAIYCKGTNVVSQDYIKPKQRPEVNQ
tara:strand:- start:177 stop:404 length:228 start_codon:yes stop_codon:yes gene_type:complete